MNILPLSSQLPFLRDGLRGTNDNHQQTRILTGRVALGNLPLRGTGPMDIDPAGLSKPFGGQNPGGVIEDHTNE